KPESLANRLSRSWAWADLVGAHYRASASDAEPDRGDQEDSVGHRLRDNYSSGSSYHTTFSPTRARILHHSDFGAASIASVSRAAEVAMTCASPSRCLLLAYATTCGRLRSTVW